jgi:hypothetical protein
MDYDWGKFGDANRLSCLAIADRHERKVRIIGSATYILPGVFATARHMLEDYLKVHMGKVGPIKDIFNGTSSFEIDLLHVQEKGAIVWKVKEARFFTDADIVLLLANQYDLVPESRPSLRFEDFPYITINLHPPRTGSKLTSLGFPKTQNIPLDGVKSEHRMELRTQIGAAIEMHHKAPMAGQFALETNTPLIGGMSGGPTFNEDGELFAINSASFDPTSDHNAYTSYHSPLTHIININIEAPFGTGPRPTTLFALAKDGFIQIKGIDHLEFTDTGYTWHSDQTCKDCWHE